MPRAMKDSGIKWIGVIPAEWKLAQIKRFAHVNNGREIQTEVDKSADAIPVYGSGGVFKYTTDYLYDGETVMFGRKGTLGKPIYADEKLCTVDTMYYLTFSKELLAKFNYYQLVAFDWEPHITQTALPSIVASEILSCKFAFPPPDEQQRIADYLDVECARIDNVIEKTRASIVEYKKLKQAIITRAVTKGMRPARPMKDSGVEWLGDIPADWEICKLKHVLQQPLQYGANQAGIPYDSKLPRYIRITDITIDGKLKDSSALSLSEEDALGYILQNNDILFARSGATVGKAFVYKMSYGRSAFAGYLIRASLGKRLLPDLLFYYTQSSIYEEWKNQIFIQATIQNIGADRYKEMPILIPPLEEQKEIAAYLNGKTAAIDSLIEKKGRLVTELERLKKSLIFEYVTGKKEAPERT